MFVCNIGQANAESVNLIKPGHDYGWPIREGTYLLDPYGDLTRLYPLPANDSTYNITYPVAYFDHDEGLAITGGFEYSGKVIPQLAGKFLFGVIGTGRLFYINMADIKQGQQALIKEWRVSFNGKQGVLKDFCNGCERVDLRLGRDADGEIYILTKLDGKIYKLVGATIK
jgi:glucose/arabinose dehydrogenase